jgi:hypothetical protein
MASSSPHHRQAHFIKSLDGKAVSKAEESVKLDLLLPGTLDNIRHRYKSIESMLLNINEQIKAICKFSVNNSNTVLSSTSNQIVGGR